MSVEEDIRALRLARAAGDPGAVGYYRLAALEALLRQADRGSWFAALLVWVLARPPHAVGRLPSGGYQPPASMAPRRPPRPPASGSAIQKDI